MQEGKVNIAQGSPKTLANLTKFKSDYNVLHPSKDEKLRTMGDAIDKLIEIAARVPELETENSNLQAAFNELGADHGRLIDDIRQLRQRIKELEALK